MQNTLPESIKERISKEAAGAFKKYVADIDLSHYTEQEIRIAAHTAKIIYTAAAEQILMNPGQWNLAGIWFKCKDKLPDKDGLYIIEHKNGGRWQMFFKTEDKKWYWQPNPYSVCGDGFIERWLSESPTPSTDTAGLVEALKEIKKLPIPAKDHCDWYQEVIKIATNALNKLQQ
jgi:hypothetical protein